VEGDPVGAFATAEDALAFSLEGASLGPSVVDHLEHHHATRRTRLLHLLHHHGQLRLWTHNTNNPEIKKEKQTGKATEPLSEKGGGLLTDGASYGVRTSWTAMEVEKTSLHTLALEHE
jgi:hypothetical protein